jgi:hypothetical protein
MGTILQEVGHDAVLVGFINKELIKSGCEFFIVTAALGPKHDIHYYDPEAEEYVSAYNISKENYIPAFEYRVTLPESDLERINLESQYKKQSWYKSLQSKIGSDPYESIALIIDEIKENLDGGVPDIIGFNESGHLILFAEVKFEGFSKNAMNDVLQEYEIAKSRDIPYFLVIPKKPIYSRRITDTWLKSNLPEDMRVYKFSLPKNMVVPKQSNIGFMEIAK